MVNIKFTENEIKALHYERFHHPHPRVRRKMEAVLLKSKNLRHKTICDVINISPNTLRSYLRDYKYGGIEKLKQTNFYQPQSELRQHTDTIARRLG